MHPQMVPAVFLDRDGVIIENCSNYVRSWADVEIFHQAMEALARLRGHPYKIVIVTNQSVVGRGYISFEEADAINRQLVAEIEHAGGRVDGVFVCPHAPEDTCSCRKPEAGLLLQAAEALSIDLSRSVMIGDAITDLQAGRAAGVGRVALVLTGRGKSQSQLAEAAALKPFSMYDDLKQALAELVPRQISSGLWDLPG